MKQLLFILVALAVLGCEKNGEKEKRDILDPNAMISIHPAQGVKSAANSEHLSALEIVKQAHSMLFHNPRDFPSSRYLERGWSDEQRDTITPRLLMWAFDIISPQDTSLRTSFLYGEDIVLTRNISEEGTILDTIAYIPNSVMRHAESLIEPAFNKQDYTSCYELFDSLFVFQPITAKEWKELKKQDKN